MQKLSTIILALLISTPAYAAPVILVCKGKSDWIRWDKSSPSGQVIESGRENQVWKMTIDTVARTLVFYPLPGLRGEPGSFDGDGDIKNITMQADRERYKDTPWEPISGSINTITGQFVIEIPALGAEPQSGFQYSGICERAKPLF